MTRRMLAAFLALSALILMILIVPLGITNQHSEQQDLNRRIERDAVAVSAIAADPLRQAAATAPKLLTSYLARYSARTHARVVVTDASGNAFVDTERSVLQPNGAARSFATRPEFAAALQGKVSSGQRNSTTLGYRLLYVTVPVASGGKLLGAVRISYPTSALDNRIRQYWFTLGAIALIVLAAAALLSSLLASWVAQPLEQLARAARAMGESDFSVRADTSHGPPEVRLLAASFNDSVATLERFVNDQAEFVADAAHQLRTPLQALRLRLENIDRLLPDADGTAQAHVSLNRAVEEIERLAQLVTSLLMLERADRGASEAVEPVDIVEMVQARQRDWSELGERKGVRIEIDVPAGATALCRPVHAEQVLDNLVDNAIGVSPKGEVVEVFVRQDGAYVETRVSDHGPGLTDDQIEHAFRRFATGRPSAGVDGGFGIGLAIVRRLTELDGGSSQLARNASGGIDAVVRLPVAPTV